MDSHHILPVFGGAFNPPHYGHLRAIESLLAHYEQVLVVPSFSHAFGKNMVSFDDRLEMLSLLFKNSSAKDRITLSGIERLIYNGKNVFSYDLLTSLKPHFPDKKLVLALGPDNIEPDTFSRFYRAKDIMSDFGVISIFEQEGERSTFCRELLAKKDNRKYQTLLNYMPHNVLEYIQQQQLYLSET